MMSGGQTGGLVWALLFGWAMSDTLILYLARPWFSMPLNTFLPFLLGAVFLFTERGRILIPPSAVIWMSCIALGYGLAIAIDVEPFSISARNMVKTICVFIIGYYAVVRQNDYRVLGNVLLLVGGLHIVVCVLALLGVSKTYLPVSYLRGFVDGSPVNRAEITTDQNYQVYYLFPMLLGLAVFKERWRIVLMAVGFIGALFIGSKLATRSGLILIVLTFSGALLIPWWYRLKGSTGRVILVAVILGGAFLYQLPALISATADIRLRMNAEQMTTFWGRVLSFTYLIEHLLHPDWWIPKGTDVFLKQYGSFPHSSPTMMYLQAGLLGLIGWVMLVIVPLMKGLRGIWLRQGGTFLAVIIFGGLISWLGAMTLPASFFEQAWLWAGATAGAAASLRAKRRPVTALKSPEERPGEPPKELE